MPTKKISEPKFCGSPDHNPPNMMVFQPGTYEHTCSACGHVTIFTVNSVTCQVTSSSW